MVADIARDNVPRALLAARDTLAAFQTPRKKTEAEQKLDDILRELEANRKNAARDSAQRKIERIKARLEALKLAAGSAAATGDARLAARIAKDIRDAAREISRALGDAGTAGAGAGLAASAAAAAGIAERQSVENAAPSQALSPASPQSQNDMASLKGEAAGILQELKKIMRKLRLTAFHPDIPARDRNEMERTMREAEREILGLAVAAAPAAGMAVDVAV